MVLEKHRPVCRRLLGVKSSPPSVHTNMPEVKTETEEEPEVFADREENYENVYKYDIGLFDGPQEKWVDYCYELIFQSIL